MRWIARALVDIALIYGLYAAFEMKPGGIRALIIGLVICGLRESALWQARRGA